MINPFDVATEGYLRGPLSIAVNGYINTVTEALRRVCSFIVQVLDPTNLVAKITKSSTIRQVLNTSIVRSKYKIR